MAGFFYRREAPGPPQEVAARWLAGLGRTVARGGLFVLSCHAHVAGLDEARLAALDSVLAAAVREPRIAIRAMDEVGAAIRATPGSVLAK